MRHVLLACDPEQIDADLRRVAAGEIVLEFIDRDRRYDVANVTRVGDLDGTAWFVFDLVV